MMDPSAITFDITQINYVGIIRLDGPTVHQEMIPMKNGLIGGLPMGFLQTKYGFSTDDKGGVVVLEADDNVAQATAIVHYDSVGTPEILIHAGSPAINGKIVSSWNFPNNIPLDSNSGDFIPSYNTTDGGFYEVRLHGNTFMPIPVPSDVKGVGAISNNTPYLYAKFSDGSRFDALVSNGDVRRFNINSSLPDGSAAFWTNGGSLPDGTGVTMYQSGSNGNATQWWIFTVPYVTISLLQSYTLGLPLTFRGQNLISDDPTLQTTLVDAVSQGVLASCIGISTRISCTTLPQGSYTITVNVGSVPSTPFTVNVGLSKIRPHFSKQK
jgi:hypothetical protein